jgi:nitrate reductase delta subunit
VRFFSPSRRPPYRLLSLLLQYPDEELLKGRPQLEEAIAGLDRGQGRVELERFFEHFRAPSGLQLQQVYVETFDLQKRCSLYLTYYVHGDTRKRGQALLRLKRLYRAAGLQLEGMELPDYLPAMLEFAELAPADAGRGLLAEHRAGLELLWRRLQDLESPYLQLLQIIRQGLPGLGLAELEQIRRLASQGPPLEEVGLQPFAPPEVMPGMEMRR